MDGDSQLKLAEQPNSPLARSLRSLARGAFYCRVAVGILSLCTLSSNSAPGATKNTGRISLPENTAHMYADLQKHGVFTKMRLILGALSMKPEILIKRSQNVMGEPITLSESVCSTMVTSPVQTTR